MTKNTARVNSDLQRSTTAPSPRPRRKRTPAQLAPKRHVLDIGKAISLAMLAEQYGFDAGVNEGAA